MAQRVSLSSAPYGRIGAFNSLNRSNRVNRFSPTVHVRLILKQAVVVLVLGVEMPVFF